MTGTTSSARSATTLALPALDGRSPLAFLAALGVLRLVVEELGYLANLAWSPGDCTATLVGAHDTVDGLASDLKGIAESIPDGVVLPRMWSHLPPPGEAPDKVRLPRVELRKYAARVWEENGAAGERWLASLVTDLSLDDSGRADISLFTAPAGKQSMRTMLEKPLATVRKNPQVLKEALTGWRRYPGVTGEYLDHRALFDAVDAPDGRPAMRGVPGATWLALMSYPLFRTTAEGTEPLTTGWQRAPGRGPRRRLVYPLWSAPFGLPEIVAALEHPVLVGAEPGPPPSAARHLSAFLVCAAERRRIPGGKSAGVLTPIQPDPAASRRSRGTRGGRGPGRTTTGRATGRS
jgi:hypothetical protein